MSSKLKETESLRAAFKAAVEAVKPIRERIRTTKEWDRYNAWQEKRNGSQYRRALNLAICYMKQRPYLTAEAKTRDSYWDRKCLIDEIAAVLTKHCGFTDVAKLRQDITNWMGGKAPALTLKLYVVVRSDLPPGAQAVQAAHAMREFAAQHPEVEKEWHEKSNTVVMLSAGTPLKTKEAGMNAIANLFNSARDSGVPATCFVEPDLNNEVTAIAIGPTGRGLVRHLPLALTS